MVRVAAILAVCAVCARPVSAQSADKQTTDEDWRRVSAFFGSMLTSFGHDAREVLTTENGAIVGGSLGTAALLWSHDRSLSLHAVGSEEVSEALTPGGAAGHGLVQVGGAIAIYAAGRLTHHPRVAHLGTRLMTAQALGGLMTHAVKLTVDRQRPNGGGRSFPSGHATAAFASASVLQHEFGWKAGVPAYLIANYIAVERVTQRQHYVSDVVVGAALGFVAGRATSVHCVHGTIGIVPGTTVSGSPSVAIVWRR